MSRSSEEVLLMVNYVRNKKTDGMLYMMGERMAWMQNSKNTFSYSHPYADIKSQKISPDSKEKVQLQVVMHNGSANTFHFNNPEGRSAQIQDRDAVKELLQQLLPKFRHKLNSELEEKNRLLKENPELFQLYKDLVVTQVITADEFWATQANKYTNGGEKVELKQQTGVSAAFLADIKPQTDGCNGLKYNLTADIIESIFRTYPMVRKKHAEHVPHEMTESDFWTRFFQSHYFHRDRTTLGNKDIFSECAKKDEEDIKEEMDKNVKDPFLDLTQLTDSTLDEGYGGTTEDKRISHNQTNLTMIRRFNYHSTMVLKACEKNKGQQESHKGDSTTSSSEQIGEPPSPMMNGEASTSSNTEQSEPVTKKARIREKLELEDFQPEEKEKSLNLQLSRMDRYLHGPTPVMAIRYTTGEDMMQATHSVATEISHWTPNLTQVISENVALSVLGELSPGGALMHGTSLQQLHQMVSPNVQEELKQQYNALCELLRHFWACFPTSSKFLEEKVVRMKSTLERFQMAKLNTLKEKLEEDRYSIDLTGHMEEMLAAAYRKFDMWQSKRMQKKS